MIIAHFFYKLYLVDAKLEPLKFIGTSFPITPNGGLLTCRHVVDLAIPEGQAIAAYDSEMSRFVVLTNAPVFPRNPAIDLAFLPNALSRPKLEFFPVLSPKELKIGTDVHSFGFFAIGANQEAIEQGYFSGKIVNFFEYEKSAETARITLPFPILEGMSGSPILTYHNGIKLVGIGIGNRQTRILASEILEFEEGTTRLRESIHRIVEYGVAYHAAAILHFLIQTEILGFVESADRLTFPDLD